MIRLPGGTSVISSVASTSFAIALFGEGGLVWATIGMTVLLVVFAEVMPKTDKIIKAKN